MPGADVNSLLPLPLAAIKCKTKGEREELTDGKFVASAGFDLRNDGAAVLSERWLDRARSAYDERSTIELSLSWEE